MPHTLAEKILLAHTEADASSRATIVMVRCDVVMTNDISGPMAFRAMEQMGATKVFDPAKVVVVPDHFVPAKDERSAELQKLLASGPSGRASPTTSRAAAGSSTRCSSRKAGSCRAR